MNGDWEVVICIISAYVFYKTSLGQHSKWWQTIDDNSLYLTPPAGVSAPRSLAKIYV